jgi:hypothetical protein
VAEFARGPNGGLIVAASAPATVNRKIITAQAAKHVLPAIYANRAFPAAGGLIEAVRQCMSPVVAHRDLASRIYVRNARKRINPNRRE